MRILVITNVVPYPPHGGIELRILRLLERVARRHEVTLCCHAWSDAGEAGARELTGAGIPTYTARLCPDIGIATLCRAAGFGITGRPPELALYRSAEMRAIVRGLLRSQPYEILHIEETILTHYAGLLPAPSSTRTVVTFHNVHSVQAGRAAALERSAGMRLWRRFNSLGMRYYEPRVAARFDRSIAVSDRDRELLVNASPGAKVDVVPNGVDTRSLAVLPQTDGPPAVLLVGNMAYQPCEDAAIRLVREILPLLPRRWDGVQAWIVGKNPGPRVRQLAGEAVFVTGEVPDLAPYYARATVAVAPLRAGSGSRLKILEAMALGRPVVSTTIGAEGLEVEDRKHLLLADDIAGFAAAIETLLADAELRKSLASAARRLVETRYDWDIAAAHLLRIYDELAPS